MENKMNVRSDWTSNLPHSYGGKFRSYDFYSDYDKKEIDREFGKIDIFSRFSEYKKLRHFTPTYVYRKRELMQVDTVYFREQSLVQANDGYQYLICFIDCFTKYAWAYPTKDLKCQTALNCFKDLFSKLEKLPEKIATDKGSEFKGAPMKKYFKDNGIKHYFSKTERKCAMVERFQLTIQKLLHSLMRRERHKKWTSLLPTAMKIYNSRKHSFTKMSPENAEKEENQDEIRKEYYKKYLKAEKHKVKPKYKKGDFVRIPNYRTQFFRGYYENYTVEYFEVDDVLTKHPNPIYKLKDLKGAEVEGTFHQNELVLFNPDAEQTYEIEEILRTKGNGNDKQYYIKFFGWPSKFNQWVYATDID